jgi:hypothetical protein
VIYIAPLGQTIMVVYSYKHLSGYLEDGSDIDFCPHVKICFIPEYTDPTAVMSAGYRSEGFLLHSRAAASLCMASLYITIRLYSSLPYEGRLL